MKSTFKTLIIAFVSSLLTIASYEYFFKKKIEIVENVKPNLLPATYSYNMNRVAGELTDFTRAAEKTVDAVVHVKNTSVQKGNVSSWLRQFYGDDFD